MKKQEIKKLSKDEVVKNIDKLKKDLFNFRFQKVNSQVTNPAKIPKGNPIKIAIIKAHVASSSVAGKRSTISVKAGLPKINELPKFPVIQISSPILQSLCDIIFFNLACLRTINKNQYSLVDLYRKYYEYQKSKQAISFSDEFLSTKFL